jgi:hypothetical protein
VDDRALLQQQLAVSHQIVKHCLNDLSDEDARRMPNATLSPIVWQVGHLAMTNVSFIQRAGLTPATPLPENYPDLFKTGTGGKADYPEMQAVVRAFDDTHEALMRALSEATLDSPNEGPRGLWKNQAEMFGFSNTHRWYHIGKINSVRALLGKPRLFG